MFRHRYTKKKKIKEHRTNTKKRDATILLALESIPCNEIMMPIDKFEKQYNKFELLKINSALKNDTNLFIDFYKNKYNVNPKTDYYNYINSSWIEKNKALDNTTYITKVDSFRLIQDKVYNEINEIYNNLIKTSSTKKEYINMKQFYISAKNLLSKEQCKNYINEFITYLDFLRNEPIKNNLWKLLAHIGKINLLSGNAPLSFHMTPNEKDTTKFCVHISSIAIPSISMLNMYLESENPKYKQLISQYLEYNTKYFDATTNDKTLKAIDVYDVIKELLLGFSTNNFNKSSTEYNKVLKDESIEKYRFNFEEYCKELGFKIIPEYFISSNLDYLKNTCILMLRDWKTEKWRSYWVGLFIRQIIRFTKDYKSISDNFYLNIIKGQDLDFNDEIRAIRLTLLPYNKTLSDLYVQQNSNKTLINYLNYMTIDLKAVFRKMIINNNWIEQKTKQHALIKLDHMKIIVGESPDYIHDPDINYVSYDIWNNLLSYAEWKHNEYISLNEKDVKDMAIIDWSEYPFKYVGSQVFVVNAMYNSTKNSIYIPLAYIQEPFISIKSDASLDYNLANIGFTIAHELSHAFDNIGSKYDYNGNLNEWWSSSDKTKYKAIQENVEKHYDAFTKKDGITIDTKMSLRENISDINAMHLCLKYLTSFLNHSNMDISSFKEVFEDFFIYYTIQMRQRINSKSLNYYNLTDPHPPDKYRVNVPLSRSDIFTALYGIKKGDGMYYPNITPIF
jgi:putative endopeptidase